MNSLTRASQNEDGDQAANLKPKDAQTRGYQ